MNRYPIKSLLSIISICIGLFPNYNLVIDCNNENTPLEITVMNSLNQVVSGFETTQSISIPTTEMNSGICLIKIIGENIQYSHKVIKQQELIKIC